MPVLYSTGPVENAGNNNAIGVLVKVLNNNTEKTVKANITLFQMNGLKKEVSSTSLTIPANNSDFFAFESENILEYEVQIELDIDEGVLLSVWGQDANATLIAAQRFVHTELVKNITTETQKTDKKIKLKNKKRR